MGLLQDAATLRRLLFTRVRGDSHRERLDAFYRGQAAGYDNFRKRLLQGRESLIERLPLTPGAIWIDLGGGTGANIAMAGDRLNHLAKIHLVDLCPSLVTVAKKRAEDAGWANVEVVEGDATQWRPAEGLADVVTFSYSLTMIPDWFLAINHALSLLRPGGTIGIVDFYVSRKFPAARRAKHPWLHRTFWPTWFAADNVWLSPDHLPYLSASTEPVFVQESLAKVPYFPFLRVPYYQYLGRKI